MSVSSGSSSSTRSSSSSWSGKSGSRTSSSKWTSASTKTRERRLPNTSAVNTLVWFSGRNPSKVKSVKVYETLYERDYDFDTRSNRSGWSTGTQTKKQYEIYFVESPSGRADWYTSDAVYPREWKVSSSNGRTSRSSRHSNTTNSWAGRTGGQRPHVDDDGSSDSSSDSESEYGMPVPPPMFGMPGPGMGPGGMGMGGGPPPPPGWGPPMGGGMPPPGFRPTGMGGPPPPPPPPGFRPTGMGGPPPPPPPPPPAPGGAPGFFKIN